MTFEQWSSTMRYHESSSLPSGWRPALWLALLVAASVAFTFGLACAMPFAAIGAAAAMTLNRKDALILTAAAWLANQIVGFAFLSYPMTADTFTWGVVLGIVAVVTTLAAVELTRRVARQGTVIAALVSFAGAFVVYEGGLFLVSATWLGGTEDFVPRIVAYILAINAGAFLGLMALHWVGAAIGLASKQPLRELAGAPHA
jgi:hypothetical protein